ncbi:MFS transporter [Gammaproteobacteria bacterium]|jgi:MFS family permease|nr:MFS transporter [Gammaproteobacteria bacterium]
MNTSALSNRNYLIYLIGNTISLHGLWIYRVALGWYAWQISNSEFWVGVVAFAQFAPAVVFGPLFGVLADRFDRRAASLLINSMSILNMLLMGLLAQLGQIDITVLAMLSLMQGTLDGAHMPVRMSVVPNLVDKSQLQSAIAITSISFNVSRFVGPALAGVVIAGSGVAAAFVLNGVSYLSLIAAMIVVRLNPATERPHRPRHVWHEMGEGVRYVLSHPRIRALLVIIAVASLFGRGVLEMMPAFADEVYQRGSAALAILTSAIGAGAIVSGLVLSRGAGWLDAQVIRWAVIAGGLLIALLGLLDQFWVAVGVVVLLGIILSLCGIGSQILIQTLVEDEVRGRVSSLWGTITFGGTALGSLLVGTAASVWGLQNVVVAAGIACSATAAISVYHSRASGVRAASD